MTEPSEGRAVRAAYDGYEVEHDALIDQLSARIKEEHARSSDASESAAKVALFIEQTGLSSKAVTWAKAILKTLDKKDGETKAMDTIRSLEAVLPMLKNHVEGQGTQDMLDGAAPADPSEDDPQSIDPNEYDSDDEDEDAETAEFNAAVDDSVVTPISFGGA